MAVAETLQKRRSPLQSPEARLLLGLVVLAAALRFATLGVQSLDADEGFTAEIARKSLGDAMSQIPSTESTPPLYYLAVWLWTKLAGTSEAGLRSLSALAGTAAVPVIYAIGADLKSRRAGLIAAALAAVSPVLVWYSQEARSYMLFMLLATVSFWAFLRALRGEPRWPAWWALASAAALATHYFALMTVLPEAIWLLMRAPRDTRRRAALAVGAVAAAGLALLPLLLYQDQHVSRPWANALSVGDELLATSQAFLVGPAWTWLIHRPGVIVMALLALTLIALALRHERRAIALPAGVAAVGLVLPFLGSLIGPKYLTPGNELAIWPLLAVIAAIGATTRRAGLWLAAAACLVMLAVTVASPLDHRLQRENWRDLIGALNAQPGPRGVELLEPFEDGRAIRYYLDRQTTEQPVNEIAVIGRPTVAPRAYFQPTFPGMQPIGLKVERDLAWARYLSPTPHTRQGLLYQR